MPGVTSISADLHKYGYTAKGASTLLFRDAESFAGMGWYFDSWPRGQYFTHTLVGARAEGAIAAAWAVMNYLGESGYRRITQRVRDTRRALQAGTRRLGLATFGDPQLPILAHGSAAIDTTAVGARMTARGWVVGHVTEPAGIHHMLNLTHEPAVDQVPGRPGRLPRRDTGTRAGCEAQRPLRLINERGPPMPRVSGVRSQTRPEGKDVATERILVGVEVGDDGHVVVAAALYEARGAALHPRDGMRELQPIEVEQRIVEFGHGQHHGARTARRMGARRTLVVQRRVRAEIRADRGSIGVGLAHVGTQSRGQEHERTGRLPVGAQHGVDAIRGHVSAACRMPHEQDALWVAAALRDVSAHPAQRRCHVERSGGIRRLGREAVFHVDADEALARKPAQHVVVHALRAGLCATHEGASVHEHNDVGA